MTKTDELYREGDGDEPKHKKDIKKYLPTKPECLSG